MTRQSTNQGEQRGRVAARRKNRSPRSDAGVKAHGLRSQSGVCIRSREAWSAWLGYQRIVIGENRRLDRLKAGWRAQANAKKETT